jgi:hypothetical protein
MPATTPCYRHARGTWMAARADCTAWHMAAIARCGGAHRHRRARRAA